MQISERAVGDVVVLDVKGRITLGDGDELLKDKVNSLVGAGKKKIILNLADVPAIGRYEAHPRHAAHSRCRSTASLIRAMALSISSSVV